MAKLIKVVPSPRDDKKYMAVFLMENMKEKTIHFGAKNYDDYTLHGNAERKERYLRRHQAREDWNNPFTAGALSRWILWNKPTLVASIHDFQKRFNL